MAGIAKPSASQAFELHMSDADELVALVRALTNSRQRAMRTELRQRVGEALKVPERDRSRLACIESDDLFVTFRPGSRIGPSDIADLRPLLRQALVAACAALETYLADKIMEQVGPLLRKQENLTPRLAAIPLSLIDFVRIQETYERHGWGLRVGIVEPFRLPPVRACGSGLREVGATPIALRSPCPFSRGHVPRSHPSATRI